MPHPCVFRAAKLKTYGNIAASGAHTWRERPTPNADPTRRHLNADLRSVVGAEALCGAIKARLAGVTDKAPDPVLAIEYLITAHHDAFKANGGTVDADAYFRDALSWIEQQHGAENIVAANIQRDELTDHLVIYAVPIVTTAEKTRKRSVIVGTNPDGTKRREVREFHQPAAVRLSASHWLDGPAKLSKMQTRFAKAVAERHGLTRGIEGSRATHTTVKQFYGGLTAAERITEAQVPTVKAKPPKARPGPEPEPPGMFSGQAARTKYERDFAKWERDVSAFKKASAAHREDLADVAEQAPKVAKRYIAKAQAFDLAQRQVKSLTRANGALNRRAEQAEARVAKLEAVTELFTPEEIQQKARERREKALQAKKEEAEAARVRRERENAAKALKTAAVATLTDLATDQKRSLAVRVVAAIAARIVKKARTLESADWPRVERDGTRTALRAGCPVDQVAQALAKLSKPRAEAGGQIDECRAVVASVAAELEAEAAPKKPKPEDDSGLTLG